MSKMQFKKTLKDSYESFNEYIKNTTIDTNSNYFNLNEIKDT